VHTCSSLPLREESNMRSHFPFPLRAVFPAVPAIHVEYNTLTYEVTVPAGQVKKRAGVRFYVPPH
jgi:hypothetical protein